MRLLLVPGFWLNGSSWDQVTDPLVAQGYLPTALTLPGMASIDEDRSQIGLRDCVNALIEEVDRSAEPVVLVGHSAGGAISHAAADARPDLVARVVYVDAFPMGEGDCVNDELPVVSGEIPFPAWSVFGDEDLVDLTDELRERFREIALPEPARVGSDRQVLFDPRRYDVAATIICCGFTSDQLRSGIDEGESWCRELGAMKDVTYIDLPTGHWPQFTKPAELAHAISSALEATQ